MTVRALFVVFRCVLLLNLGHELLAGLECRDVMGRDNQCRVLGDVASGLLSTLLQDEAAEATKIDGFSVNQAFLDGCHHSFNASQYCGLVNAGLLGNLFR